MSANRINAGRILCFVDIEVCRRGNHWQPEHFYLGGGDYLAAVDMRTAVEAIYAGADNEYMRAFFTAQEIGNHA